jgi:hypothetical protein
MSGSFLPEENNDSDTAIGIISLHIPCKKKRVRSASITRDGRKESGCAHLGVDMAMDLLLDISGDCGETGREDNVDFDRIRRS